MNELQFAPNSSVDSIYELLVIQVQSYMKSRHMQGDTSISQELARELLDSIRYTLGNGKAKDNLAQSFAAGQTVVRNKLQQANRLLALVEASWDRFNLWLWDTIGILRRFLQEYDPAHLAHRQPVFLPYPLLCNEVMGEGMDYVLGYLQCIWTENRILAAFDHDAVLALVDCLPPDYWAGPQNSCEQLLCNALGRILLGLPLYDLLIPLEKLEELGERITQAQLEAAAHTLCKQLNLLLPAADYALRGLKSMFPRMRIAATADNLSAVFLLSS